MFNFLDVAMSSTFANKLIGYHSFNWFHIGALKAHSEVVNKIRLRY